eukprot:scaffold33958_cov136-Isochrysis_galbana.AAC.7
MARKQQRRPPGRPRAPRRRRRRGGACVAWPPLARIRRCPRQAPGWRRPRKRGRAKRGNSTA